MVWLRNSVPIQNRSQWGGSDLPPNGGVLGALANHGRYPSLASVDGHAPFLTEIGGMAPQKRADQTGPSWAGQISLPIGGVLGARANHGRYPSLGVRSRAKPGDPGPPSTSGAVSLSRRALGAPRDSKRGVRSVAGRQGQTPLTGSGTKSFQCTNLCVLGGFRTPTHFEIKNSVGHANFSFSRGSSGRWLPGLIRNKIPTSHALNGPRGPCRILLRNGPQASHTPRQRGSRSPLKLTVSVAPPNSVSLGKDNG